MGMRITLLIVQILIHFSSYAQTLTDDPARPVLGKTGEIFTLKLTPYSRRLEITLVGTPAVTLDPERLTVFGRVVSNDGPPKTLRIQAAGGHFEILDKIEPNSSLEFDIKDKTSKKSETLRVKQTSRP
jgi:hypothetical protein